MKAESLNTVVNILYCFRMSYENKKNALVNKPHSLGVPPSLGVQ